MIPELIIGSPCCSSILSILWSVKRDVGGRVVTLVNTSQMLGPLPSSFQAPSIWSRCKMIFLCGKKSVLPDRQLWPIPRGSHQERFHRAAPPQDCTQEQGWSGERRRGGPWSSSQAGLPRLPRCRFQVAQGDKANCAKGSLCTQDFE